MTFKPERFLSSDDLDPEPDPHVFVFGFGRRICPGRHLADNALFLNIAQTLAVFNISKHAENGKEVEPVVKFEPGVVSHPAPFENEIRPRSERHERLIRGIEEVYPWQKGDGEVLENITSSKFHAA
jgi:hypothetical protein